MHDFYKTGYYVRSARVIRSLVSNCTELYSRNILLLSFFLESILNLSPSNKYHLACVLLCLGCPKVIIKRNVPEPVIL
jgi:hypothetical protein